MVGIVGGSFGLYGYLPAVCIYYSNTKVLIEERHKDKFLQRPELLQYKDNIIWESSVKNIINKVELLILAIPPVSVKEYLNIIVESPTIKKIIVDKPICEDPLISENFIQKIEEVGIKIISSYLFIYTDWISKIKATDSCIIKWDIINKNPLISWKRNPLLGGGDITFYGIHLLSVAAYVYNELNPHSFKFYIDSNSNINKFDITIGDNQYISESPFLLSNTNEDNRIPYIVQLFNDLDNNYETINNLMKKTNELWKQVKPK